MLYDTPKAALQDLTDDERFERVAVHVLRVRHPELRITGPTGDIARDGHDRLLFATDVPTVLLASIERGWTGKLSRELVAPTPAPAVVRAVAGRGVRRFDGRAGPGRPEPGGATADAGDGRRQDQRGCDEAVPAGQAPRWRALVASQAYSPTSRDRRRVLGRTPGFGPHGGTWRRLHDNVEGPGACARAL